MLAGGGACSHVIMDIAAPRLSPGSVVRLSRLGVGRPRAPRGYVQLQSAPRGARPYHRTTPNHFYTNSTWKTPPCLCKTLIREHLDLRENAQGRAPNDLCQGPSECASPTSPPGWLTDTACDAVFVSAAGGCCGPRRLRRIRSATATRTTTPPTLPAMTAIRIAPLAGGGGAGGCGGCGGAGGSCGVT